MDFKIYTVLFILFLLVRSQPFNKILLKVNGTTTADGNPNMYGTIVQGVILVIAFIALESLINHELL